MGVTGSDHVGFYWTIVRALVSTLSGWRVRVTGRFCREEGRRIELGTHAQSSDMKWLRVSKNSSGCWVACRLFKGAGSSETR